jgi:lysozyme
MLKGIDVSHWQPLTRDEWQQSVTNGVTFCFIKATDGASEVSPTLNSQTTEAKAVGLVTGFYHFIQPKEDPVDQLENFINTVPYRAGDLPPVLDIEVPNTAQWSGDLKAQVLECVKTFVSGIELSYRTPPILYGSPAFLKWLSLPQDYERCPLWLAEYGAITSVAIPKPWLKYTFWQYSQTTRLPGISMPLDASIFPGTMDDLKLLTLP